MKTCEVYARKGKRRHLVDTRLYSKVSESKSLCGKTGKDYFIPDAAYYIGQTWRMCAKCRKLAC